MGNEQSDVLREGRNPDSGVGMKDLVDRFRWEKTVLGRREHWPLALQVIVNTCLRSPRPLVVLWGEDMIQLYNNAYRDILGVQHPGALGRRSKDVWAESWAEVGPLLENVLAEGKSFLLEDYPFVLNRNDGAEECRFIFSFSPLCNEVNKTEGILVSVNETTEKLKKSEERYHKMVEEVQDYAIILLDSDGIIQNWNKGAEKIKQYTEAEAVGKHFRMFYLPEDIERNLPAKLIGEATRNGRAHHEGWRMRKDKTRFWGSITLTALHDAQNKLIGFSKVTRDLTERKLAEDKIHEYLLELESRNRELEQFAFVASHDLQEPLRKISLFINLIEGNLHDEALLRKYMKKITSSAGRMSELIKSVLNYSRLAMEATQLVSTDLNIVLAEVLTDFELLIAEKKATIRSEPLPVVRAIPLQMRQLFANLVSNALKFTDIESLISITSRIVSNAAMINPPEHHAAGDYLELAFADNGVGFGQQYETIIFSMFQRLYRNEKFSGTGIGLALCKKIVENHGGYITAIGEPGKGATFYVYFPAAMLSDSDQVEPPAESESS